MRFQYFEIRPCVTYRGAIHSFLGEPEFHEGIGGEVSTPAGALAEAEETRRLLGIRAPVFWTIYGIDTEGLATAIGDFKSFEDAHEVMNAILAPMAAARDLIRWGEGKPDKAADDLDDFINQCSTSERL